MIRYEVGDVVNGQYELLQRLDKGRFGVIFRARDTVEARHFAIKFLMDGGCLEDIHRELGPLLRIDHPNVVRGRGWGETPEGIWFLVTDLIEGRNLQEVVEGDGVLSAELLRNYGSQLLSALQAIHPNERRLEELKSVEQHSVAEYDELREIERTGLVHRDIKPLNVMIGERGVVLVDFGISSRAGTEIETRSHTADFLPPDLPMQGTGTWTADVDRYAAVATLYLATFAQLPPWGRPSRTHSPESRNDLPHELISFFETACAASVDERFPSTAQMVAEWDNIPWDAQTTHVDGVWPPRFVAWHASPSTPSPEDDNAARRLILEIVAAEGPILCRRLYRLFGSVAGDGQVSRLNRLVYHMARNRTGGVRPPVVRPLRV